MRMGGSPPIRMQAVVPGAHVHEHCSSNDAHLGRPGTSAGGRNGMSWNL